MANRVADCYPFIDPANLLARYDHGPRTCTWHLRDDGAIGTFRVLRPSNDAVVLDCDFRGFGIYYPASGQVALPLYRRETQPVSGGREYFECRLCSAARSKLFLVVGEWGCRVCHKLKHRSSREGSLARLWREKDELSSLLSSGKPKLMRELTYAKKLGRLEKVTELIAGRARPRANERLGDPIEQTWS
jgi:hypothetical protein